MRKGRQSPRLRNYDYTSPGAYFITVCSHRKRPVFQDRPLRDIVEAAWRAIPAHFLHVRTDDFVIMPHHVHGILWIVAQPGVGAQHAAPLRSVRAGSLGATVRSLKAAVTKRYNESRTTGAKPLWQRNYYERVIRSDEELQRVREYIRMNPLKWELDPENPHRIRDFAHARQWRWLEGGLR